MLGQIGATPPQEGQDAQWVVVPAPYLYSLHDTIVTLYNLPHKTLQVIRGTQRLATYFGGFNSLLMPGVKTQGDFWGHFRGKMLYETENTVFIYIYFIYLFELFNFAASNSII
jgi:hypothetical protein